MVKLSPPRLVKAAVSQPSRALNTIYQNNTGRPLLVFVSCGCTRVATNDYAYMLAYTGDSTPPTTLVAGAGHGDQGAASRDEFEIAFAVPIGHYYRIVTYTYGTSTVILDYWTEVQL